MVRKQARTQRVERPISRDVNAGVRARKALECRLLGSTYAQIAETVGYASRSAAWTAVQRELGRSLLEPAEDVKQLELHRLDLLLQNQLVKVLENGNWNYQNVQQVLAIMDRRAKYLGLDAVANGAISAQVLIREYAVPTLEGI